MVEFARRKRTMPALNLTALVDVVFLLMVFFMMTSTFVKSESMELALPPDQVAQENTKDGAIYVVLVEDGVMYLGKNKINPAMLRPHLVELLKEKPDRKILLMSSSRNSVQAVVMVMDDIYQSGARNVSLANWVPK